MHGSTSDRPCGKCPIPGQLEFTIPSVPCYILTYQTSIQGYKLPSKRYNTWMSLSTKQNVKICCWPRGPGLKDANRRCWRTPRGCWWCQCCSYSIMWWCGLRVDVLLYTPSGGTAELVRQCGCTWQRDRGQVGTGRHMPNVFAGASSLVYYNCYLESRISSSHLPSTTNRIWINLQLTCLCV